MQIKSSGLTDVGFWQRFWSRLTSNSFLDKGQTRRTAGQGYSDAGTAVSVETALRLSAVWACVRLRSETIGSLPCFVMNRDKTIAYDHPLHEILHNSPNFDMTSNEFFSANVAQVDLRGNSYSLVERSGKKILSITPLNPQKMAVKRVESGALKYVYTMGGVDTVFNEDDILHFRGFTLDGVSGLSAIEYHADIIGAQIDANSAASKEFKNSLKMGGFLEVENVLNDKQRDQLRSSLDAFGRPENVGKWMVLEANMKASGAQNIRMSPVAAQLLETRYFGIEEICRATGVLPPLIGHTDKASSWASSLSNLNRGFLIYSVRPTLDRMEKMMEKRLLSPVDRQKYSIRFNFRALLRGDFAEQTAGYASALQNGWMNIDEVRDFEDFPRLPNNLGEEYRVPLNMTTVGKNNAIPKPPL